MPEENRLLPTLKNHLILRRLKEIKDLPMNDALAALKQKFGK